MKKFILAALLLLCSQSYADEPEVVRAKFDKGIVTNNNLVAYNNGKFDYIGELDRYTTLTSRGGIFVYTRNYGNFLHIVTFDNLEFLDKDP